MRLEWQLSEDSVYEKGRATVRQLEILVARYSSWHSRISSVNEVGVSAVISLALRETERHAGIHVGSVGLVIDVGEMAT